MKTKTVTILGDEKVGKTCLCVQFTQDHFYRPYDPTFQESYFKKSIRDPVTSEDMMVELVDTVGAEQFRNPLSDHSNVSRSDCVVVMYAVDNWDSFEEAEFFLAKIRDCDCCMGKQVVLIGNKKDCRDDASGDCVERFEGERLAGLFGCSFLEISLAERDDVDLVVNELLRSYSIQGDKNEKKPKKGKKSKQKKGNCSIL
eukprot:TRINITY_DN4485_c0_g1_i1.p1 TRINITY_DN4485_c0_g1~~TRINITY_DN4485_c0_g1_i1.p1  ORF type:complete len:225 (+),score=59.70 TRINITY_DN4485_c0_g1_i1:78-677(+)